MGWSDEDLVAALSSKDRKQINEALKILHNDQDLRRSIDAYVRQRGGNTPDVKAQFNLALVTFYQDVGKDKFQLSKGAIRPYIIGIVKKKFFTEQRSLDRSHEREQKSTLQNSAPPPTPEELLHIEERKNLIEQALQNIDDKCAQLLRAYSKHFRMKEIAEMYQYKNAQSASMAVANCRKKIRDYLQKTPNLRAALIEFLDHG